MKLEPARAIRVFLEPEAGRRLHVGRLALKNRQVLFEYDADFIASGLELSPFKMPLGPGVVTGDPAKFDGLMGVFDDSLPDGWGRLLIDRRAAKAGIPPGALSPLDRLLLVGHRGMGALVYEPQVELEPPTVVQLSALEADTQAVMRGVSAVDLDRLVALGGSPQGARPKVLVQLSSDGTVLVGDSRPRPGFEPWLVKFRARDDDQHAAALEHAYLLMAAAAGIDAPASRLLGRTSRHPGFFAVRRFDREGKKKLHLHTLSGLLNAPLRSSSLTYRDVLKTARALTRNESDVRELFRRACFNVFAHNRDDHARNFAFLMDARGAWRASPAYDLTYSHGPGGEHTMLVDTEGANPTRAHLERLAASAGLRRTASVIDEVRAAVSNFHRFADEAGVARSRAREVGRALGVRPPAR